MYVGDVRFEKTAKQRRSDCPGPWCRPMHSMKAVVAIAAMVLGHTLPVSATLGSDCVGYEVYKDRIDYCAEFVNYPITSTANLSLAALQGEAHSRYLALREVWANGTSDDVTGKCLSFEARYQCVTLIPSCFDGRVSAPYVVRRSHLLTYATRVACLLVQPQYECRHFCEERARRCDEEEEQCAELPQLDCSVAPMRASAATLSMVVAASAAVLQCMRR